MKAILYGDPKEIASLIKALQEKQSPVTNTLVLNSVDDAARTESDVSGKGI